MPMDIVERACRKLCDMRGVNPEDLIPIPQARNGNILTNATPVLGPAWKIFQPEIERMIQMNNALFLAQQEEQEEMRNSILLDKQSSQQEG